MHRVAIGVQEADGDGFHPIVHQGFGGGPHVIQVQLGDNFAVTVQPFRHLQPAAARHQRGGILQKQIVNIVALLGTHFQNVAETARGDQAKPGAFAFNQRVGHQGGAVHNLPNIGQRQPGGGDDLPQPFQRANRRVRRGGEAFMQPDIVAFGIEQDEVGERAANIETDTVAWGCGHAILLRRGAAIQTGSPSSAPTRRAPSVSKLQMRARSAAVTTAAG